jgi:hypothetical protein
VNDFVSMVDIVVKRGRLSRNKISLARREGTAYSPGIRYWYGRVQRSSTTHWSAVYLHRERFAWPIDDRLW